ncbi:MAG: branched-chain amino acid ABC transporter permease [Eubacteriales bacterium]|nr:branched-chain amino acid ABC transporter permease [Eubacteriales bacterium]
MIFWENVINGLSLGSVYAIIALGYSMVYGISKMLNFAHGDVIMVGAYVSFSGLAYLQLPPLLTVLLAMGFCSLLGILIEGLAYRPLRGAGSLAVLITAIGVSYFLQNVALLIFGSAPKSYRSILAGVDGLQLMGGQLLITSEALATLALCFLVMLAMVVFTEKTKAGKAMRAVAEDNKAAKLMGINVNTTIALTFALGSGLAALAGILLCSSYPALLPTTGAMPGIKAFTAAVFGGIGSLPGAMLGGLVLGLIEILGRAYVSSELSDALVFGVLILVLLIKPTGLLGKPMREKV